MIFTVLRKNKGIDSSEVSEVFTKSDFLCKNGGHMKRNMSKLVMAIAMLLPVMLSAQILPNRTYGGVLSERAHALVQGGGESVNYIMAGFTTIPLDTNILIVKVDSAGNVLHAKIGYRQYTEIATSMIKTTVEPGYILTGWTRDFGGPPRKANIFVIKLNLDLSVAWGKIYSSAGIFEDRAYSIIELSPMLAPTGGYALVGWTESAIPQPGLVLMQLDLLGNQVSTRIYHRRVFWEPSPILTPTEGYDLVEVYPAPGIPFGGLAITGRSSHPYYNPGTYDAFTMLVNNVGAVVWFKTLSGNYNDEAYSIVFDNDPAGPFIVSAGWTNSFGPGTGGAQAPANVYIWKISVLGVEQWKNTYGLETGDQKLMDEQGLLRTNDGNYVIAGWTNSTGPGIPNSNFWMMKVMSGMGIVMWSKAHPSIPGSGNEQAYPIIETFSSMGAPTGYAVAGWTDSPEFVIGQEDFHFVTLDQTGSRPRCVLEAPVLIVPIPFSEPETAVFYIELFDYTTITLRDTIVQSHEICGSVDTNDVGPTDIDIMFPFDSTAIVSPSCTLYNHGNTTVSYYLQMTIGGFYAESVMVNNHLPRTSIPITFPSRTNWPRGTHSVTAISQLGADQNRHNDTLIGSIFVHVHDVGTQEINYPVGNADSVASFTPQAKVRNYGNVQETFNVKFTIAGPTKTTWTDDTTVTVGAGNTLSINFAPWTVTGAGNYTTKCSTELAGDMNNSNDKQDSVFSVVGAMDYNVGTVAIYMPTAGDIDSTATITPQAKVKNYGSNTETFNVKFTIQGPAKTTWVDDTTVTINSLDSLTIDFADWTVGPQGDYSAKCSTELSTDMFAGNDKKEVSFAVVVPPPVSPGWAQKESILHPGDLKAGKYTKDGASLTSERGKIYAFPGNKSWQFFRYTTGTPGFWTVLESIPFGPKPSDPTKPNKKKIGKGASLCAEGDMIYATKGNGTNEFWAYDIDGDSWIQLTSVPVTKGLKGGTSILHWGRAHNHNHWIYLLAGSQKSTQPNFFRYDIAGDTAGGSPWTTLTSVPLDPDGKPFKDGSCIVLADKKIWALKGSGKHNYFWMYDSTLNSWRSKETIPLMYPTSLITKPKKNKVKAGGAMTVCDDLIYAIKGGGKQDFWAYNYDDSIWIPKDTIPRLSAKSVPKSGAALCELDDKVWLLKGNNSAEFWCYTPAPTKSNIKYQISNITGTITPIQSGRTTQISELLQVMPNPFKRTTIINYTVPIQGRVMLKLYNASGRLVKAITDEYHDSGAYTINLTNIASGIYFLRYKTNNNKSEVKLIVQ